MKRVFVIDWILFFSFLLSACSGLCMHFLGHGGSHGAVHALEPLHIVMSVLFLVAGIFHVRMHWGWYSGLMKNGLGQRSRVTLLVTVVFVAMGLTGLILLGMDGPKHGLGRWHYMLGLFSTALFLWHILKRFPVLRKSLTRQVRR